MNASFPGGNEACYKWMAKHVKYPVKAMQKGIQGTVMVSFVVGTDGSISDVKVLKSPDSSLSREAERVVHAMPQWRPAIQGNKKVRSRLNIPIRFRLS